MATKTIWLLAIIAVVVIGAVLVVSMQSPSPPGPSGGSNQGTGGAGGTGAGGTSGSITDYYTGFMKVNKGAWATWEMTDSNGNTTDITFVYAGRATMDGKEADGFEFSSTINGEEVAAQVWLFSEDRSVVKYVVKYQGKVICYTPPHFEVKPSSETPSKYSPDVISRKPDISFGTFTTRTGKTVKVVKFTDTENGKQEEVWLSSEVPFGIVKIIGDGKTIVELVDFGPSGGQLTITPEEAENCMSIPSMP